MAVPYGKYLLERKIAEGGMAEIFLARPNPALSTEKRKQIVVKRLFAHHSSESEFVRMFFNESRLASRLKHPNIVDIFDQGETDGTYFLAMEYIHGEDLRGIAQKADEVGRRPPMAIIVRIIIDMLAGLHYAHSLTDDVGQPLGVVHRDISPQNVLVTYDGQVKVIDFGIAKATQSHDSEQTQAGMIKGKYAYMSPEQTRSGKLDARSDVFSSGTLLWELVGWRRLFKRGTDLATLVAVTEEPAPSLLLVNPEVPKELDDIVLKSLAMDPANRYSSALEFQQALVAFVERAGWDASKTALARFMGEIFADKLSEQRALEGRVMAMQRAQMSGPNAALRVQGSGGLNVGRAPAAAPAAAASNAQAPAQPASQAAPPRQRAMTMPLQVINPAVAAEARKAMAAQAAQKATAPADPSQRASQRSMPGPPAPAAQPAGASSSAQRPVPAARPVGATPSATSLPLRPALSGANHQPVRNVPSATSLPLPVSGPVSGRVDASGRNVVGPSQAPAPAPPPPVGLSPLPPPPTPAQVEASSPSNPKVDLSSRSLSKITGASQSMAIPQQTSAVTTARLIVAVFLGVLVGLFAILLVKYLSTN